MRSLEYRLRELEEFREDFAAGAYPQRSALGPGAINSSFIKAKSISGSMIDVSELAAITTKTGSLNVTGGGITLAAADGSAIKSGLTGYTDIVNSGFWLGIHAGVPKLLIGSNSGATTPRIDWNGSALEIIGAIKAESGYLKTMTVSGVLDLASSGVIKSGKTAYGTGTGIWLEYNGGTPRFDIGSATRYLRWDGTGLTFTGTLSAVDGTFSGALSAASGTFAGSLSGATGTFSGGVTASSLSITGTASFSGGSMTLPGGGSINSSALDINSATFGGVTIDGTLTLGTGGKITDADGSEWSQTGIILKSSGAFGDAIKWQNGGVDKGSIWATASYFAIQYGTASGDGYVNLNNGVASLGVTFKSSVQVDQNYGTYTWGKVFPGYHSGAAEPNGTWGAQQTYYVEGAGPIQSNGIGIGGMLGISSGNTINLVSPGTGGSATNWSGFTVANIPDKSAGYFIIQIAGTNYRVPFYANA
jgi:hypothetical protein